MKHYTSKEYGNISPGFKYAMLKHYLTLSGWVVRSEQASSIVLSNIHNAAISIDENNDSKFAYVKGYDAQNNPFPKNHVSLKPVMDSYGHPWTLLCDDEKFYWITEYGLFFFGPIVTTNQHLKSSHVIGYSLNGYAYQPNLFDVKTNDSEQASMTISSRAEGIPWSFTSYLKEDANKANRDTKNTEKGVLDIYPANVLQANGRLCGRLSGVWILGDTNLPENELIGLDSGKRLLPIKYGVPANRLLGYEIDG